MAIEHIAIPENSSIGRLIRSVIDSGVNYRDLLDRAANALESRRDGTDYTAIESVLSLEAGQGEVVYTMLMGSRNAINNIGATDADKAYAIGKLEESLRRLDI